MFIRGGCNMKTMSPFLTCVSVPGHYQNKLDYLILSGRYFYSCIETDLTEKLSEVSFYIFSLGRRLILNTQNCFALILYFEVRM